MKPTSSLRLLFLCAATAAIASAQVTVVDTARRGGEREFTIGGSGASNKAFDNSFGGVNLSYGVYSNETQAWVLRQSINYSNPNRGSTQWNGSTRVAFNQHLAARGPVRPFIGINVGGVYGDAVRDTWAAGLEGGGKYYVAPRTFLYALVEYGWFFRNTRDVDDRFRAGQFNWSLGVGYNF